MPLRITRIDGETSTLLRVDGRLEGELLDELEQACAASRPPLTLDLEGLQWIDEPAAEALARLRAEGVVVTHVSPFVALLLKGGARQV